MMLRALQCGVLLALAAGCGGTETVTVTTTVTTTATTTATVPGTAETIQFGFIKSLTRDGQGYLLRFDPALWLGGETANVAAAEDGSVEPGESVPNDYYIIDEGHRLLTYHVPADTTVTLVALGPKSTPTTVAELAEIVAGARKPPWLPLESGFWLRARIDTVRSLDHQYRP